MSQEIRKKVDENWKAQVEKEKEQAKQDNKTFHEASFILLISSLSMQAMIFMGEMENPATKQKEFNLEQARFLIDTLGILQEKTKNNLTNEESHFLEESLFNLRIKYVEVAEKEGKK